MKYLWGKEGFEGPPTCILFELRQDGREHTLWKRRLLNVPDRITIEEGAYEPYVFTLGTQRIIGGAHFLMIYDNQGKVVSDLQLTDLLLPDEIKTLPHDKDPFDWMDAAEYEMGSRSDGYLRIHLKSRREIKISLNTGKVE